jgi:O-antigen/teichoic acid export membrane protein
VAPALRYRWRGANRQSIRRIASFSTSLFVIDISGRLQTKSAEFIIASLQTLASVTPYALARKLGELSEVLAKQIVAVVMPVASALDASDDSAKVRRLYIVASRVMLGITVPITTVFAMLGGTILTLWVGPQYAAYSNLLAVLACTSLVTTSQWPAVEVLLGIGRHRLIAATTLCAGLTSIALAVALLPFGLIGVAWGTLIAAAAGWLGIVLPFAARTLRVPWRTLVSDVWAPALIPASAAALVLGVFAGDQARPTATTAAGLVCALVVYAAAYINIPAARAERRLLADIVASARRSGTAASIAGVIGWQRRV